VRPPTLSHPASDGLIDPLQRAFFVLLKASQCARKADRSAWEFAVELSELKEAGLALSDLRWMVLQGHVRHAVEITDPESGDRCFVACDNLAFAPRTCFILTDAGIQVARHFRHVAEPGALVHAQAPAAPSVLAGGAVPSWDAQRRELRLGPHLVKKFKVPAPNQELVLCAFEECAWPERVDDPLPPAPEQNPKLRLHDTINRLNRNQIVPVMLFGGDGRGCGIRWRINAAERHQIDTRVPLA
jgi:hypothetical protein